MSEMMVGIILNSIQWIENDTADSVLEELENKNFNAWKVSDDFIQIMVGDIVYIMQKNMALIFIPNYVNDGVGQLLMQTKTILELDAG